MTREPALRFCLVASILAFGLAQPAFAEIRPSDISLPAGPEGLGPGYGKKGLQLTLETSFFNGEFVPDEGDAQPHSAVLPKLKIAQTLGKNEVELIVPMLYVSGPSALTGIEDVNANASRSTFRFGNPSFVYYFTWRSLSRQMRVGLGTTMPFARRRDDKVEQELFDQMALGAASLAEAQRNIWLYNYDAVSAIGHFDYLRRQASGVIYGGELKLVPMFNLNDSAETSIGDGDRGIIMAATNDIEIVAQARLEMALDTTHIRSALRFDYMNLVTAEDLEGDQADQMALSPELRIRIESVDLLVGGSFPLDAPAGFGLDDNRYWSVMFGITNSTELLLPEGD